MIEGVLLTRLARISTPGGDVLHALRCDDVGFRGFGEAYFSLIDRGAIKGWKRHRRFTLNLVVPVGSVRFVIYDDRSHSATCGQFQEVAISTDSYFRLTVPPMVWMGFQGVGHSCSVILDVTDFVHDPQETDRRALSEIEFDWSGRL